MSVVADTVRLRIGEEQDRVEYVPMARELAEQKRYRSTRIPTHEHLQGGRCASISLL